MRILLVLAAAVATSCASSPPPAPAAPAGEGATADSTAASTATLTPTATAEPTPTPTATPPAGPPPTGGTVLVGDIAAPKKFNPKPAIEALKPKMLDCYNQVRASNPGLHGKLALRIQVNEAGTAIAVDAAPGGSANDPALVSCLAGVVKGTTFPKPGGMATVLAPMVFHP